MIRFDLINNDDDLNKKSREWFRETEVAIDLECENNLHHYGTTLSIIQISTNDKNWIVDMLSINNPKPLVDLFINKNIVKVFHDVSFDFRILQEVLHCVPKNVFDTSLGAQLIGWKPVGLGSLLEKHFNVSQEKKFQKADWLKRPMSKEMLSYAVRDTAYSLKLKRLIENQLVRKGRLKWAKEEFLALENANYVVEPQTHLSIRGAGTLNSHQKNVLKAIYDEREKIAKKLDRPVYFIISNKLMLDLAKNPPNSVKQWERLKGVHPLIKRRADVLFSAIINVKEGVEKVKRERPKRLSAEQAEKLGELVKLRNELAEKLGIDGHLIIKKEDLIRLVTGQTMNILKKWQKELLRDRFSGILSS